LNLADIYSAELSFTGPTLSDLTLSDLYFAGLGLNLFSAAYPAVHNGKGHLLKR
jgi:hypothetical protein